MCSLCSLSSVLFSAGSHPDRDSSVACVARPSCVISSPALPAALSSSPRRVLFWVTTSVINYDPILCCLDVVRFLRRGATGGLGLVAAVCLSLSLSLSFSFLLSLSLSPLSLSLLHCLPLYCLLCCIAAWPLRHLGAGSIDAPAVLHYE